VRVGMSRNVPDDAVVDAVLTASRTLVAVAEQSLGAAAEETTLAQYRALVVLASRGPQRLVDLARALEVTPPTAGRMCDRLVRKGVIRRHRARSDRREVQVSITGAGRQVVDQATARRRELIAEILGRLPVRRQAAVAAALQSFAAAAGEVPDSQWPELAAGVDAVGEPRAANRERAPRAAAGTRAAAASAAGPV
jgi:DNA-binding MarR family transcriptional regulator